MKSILRNSFILLLPVMLSHACNNAQKESSVESEKEVPKIHPDSPLVSHIYTADPSAHVFNGKIFIYPSHDTSTGTPQNDNGDHFDMLDYRILSMDSVHGTVTDHGPALKREDIPWAGKQLWAPDAAFDGTNYYLYFPAKDKAGIFRLGVAVGSNPGGPFVAEKDYIAGSYSIDPCIFKDEDGTWYMYFGGIWGGQLQRWNNNKYDSAASLKKADQDAILPRMAKMKDMKSFAEPVKEIRIVDSTAKLYREKDNDKRFFEAAWMHKYKGKYYFSYSTGDTHNIVYATGDSPYGPFTYRGVILPPVEGWTNHHSIIEINGKWWLFYHDAARSGQTHLRNVKVKELSYNEDGTIKTITK